MKPAICLDPLYPELMPEDKIKRIAAAGFQYVEFWGWRDKNVPALLEACQRHHVEVVNFSGHRAGSPVAQETHELFLRDLVDAVKTAQQLHCATLMLLTNALNEDGSVTDSFDQILDTQKYENTVMGLKKALEVTPDEVNFVLEPLNTAIDHPGYYMADMQTASSLVRDVGNQRLKILCDLYHLGVMGSNLEDVIATYLSDIGYFHIADVPGRHEPGTGSVDWLGLLHLIRNSGYTGYVGFEYFPKHDSNESLQAIQRLWQALP
jgi:hydroxypyruvate isomerase